MDVQLAWAPDTGMQYNREDWNKWIKSLCVTAEKAGTFVVDHFNKPFTGPNKSKIPNLEGRFILGDHTTSTPWTPDQEAIRKRNREAAFLEWKVAYDLVRSAFGNKISDDPT